MSAKTLAITAALLIAAGLLIGLIPVTSSGTSCGSAFVRSSDARVTDYSAALRGRSSDIAGSCTDLRGILRIPAILLLGLGAVALVAAGAASNREAKARGIG